VFLAKFKARTDGDAPFFTSDQLPAYQYLRQNEETKQDG